MNTGTARTQVKFRSILYATDFSHAAAHAIPYVKKIAEHYDADLVTLYVRPPAVDPATPPANWQSYLELGAAEDDQHRQEVFNTFAGIRTQVVIEEGDILARLETAIEKDNTDLVVIGTRGRNGLGRLLLGSVAEDIFRTVSCPVLSVGPHSDSSGVSSGELRKVLYATDLSPESRAAAPYAISLAEQFQARLTLIHVIPEPEANDLVAPVNVKAGLEKLLREVVPPEAEAWCKPEYFVECGHPADKVLERAHLKKPDLIVLGVRPDKSEQGAATHLPTAIAHKIVSHAECPVLTVRH